MDGASGRTGAGTRNALSLQGLALIAMTALPSAAMAGTAKLNLRPVTENGAVTAIDVAIDLDGGSTDGFSLTAPVVYPGATGVADRMQGIRVSDAQGNVPLGTREDPAVPGGFPYYRHWDAGRAIRYPVKIRYRASIQPPGGPGGPAFGIRAVGGGLSGAGSTLLLLPAKGEATRTEVRWDLSNLPKGSIASTSYGDGDFSIDGDPSQLTQAWILAGPAGRFPQSGGGDGFSAAWLGTPTFDAPTEMRWTQRAYDYLDSYFPHLKPKASYRVFMQFRDEPPFGGATALHQSFMLSRGPLKPDEKSEAPRGTLFHEMIHMWVGGIDEPHGISSWFAEGLTSYYEYLLPARGGFKSLDEFEASINRLAEEYFTSKARNWSAEAITKVGFADEEVRHTPYRRSALYFYDLDARIRAKSEGKRSLDDLVFPMFLSREKGERFDHARWIAMVTEELGPEEKGRFERLILQGSDTIEPDSDAFGPCFKRMPTQFTHHGKTIAAFKWVKATDMEEAECRAYFGQ